VQTRYFSVSPAYQNRLGAGWDYQMRYRLANSDADNNELANTTTHTVNASIGNAGSSNKVFTVLSANGNEYHREGLPEYRTGQAQLLLGWRPNLDLNIFISGGSEYSGYLADDRTHPIYDAGFTWRPGKRTTLDVSAGHRFYGETYNVSLKHSTRMTDWQISHTKSATTTQDSFAALVQQTGTYLGIPAIFRGHGTVLSNTYILQEITQLLLTLRGARNTVGLSAYRSKSSNLTNVTISSSASTIPGVVIGNDFATFGSEIRQDGGAIDWEHRLDKRSSLRASYAHTHSHAVFTNADSTADTLSLGYQYQIGAKTSSSLLLRHFERKNTGGGKVTENALVASLRTEF
jgi:hypothetical protein